LLVGKDFRFFLAFCKLGSFRIFCVCWSLGDKLTGVLVNWLGGASCWVFILLISFSFWSSCITLYRLFSIRRSYINRRSRTFEFEKSLIIDRPRKRSSSGNAGSLFGGLGRNAFVILANGLSSLRASRASKVWVWMVSVRFRRHERDTIRSARMDSIGVAGASSSSRRSRWKSNSSWLSDMITLLRAKRPCLMEFCDAAALPWGVFGPVDFCELVRFAVI